jgi:hypothetical protein
MGSFMPQRKSLFDNGASVFQVFGIEDRMKQYLPPQTVNMFQGTSVFPFDNMTLDDEYEFFDPSKKST